MGIYRARGWEHQGLPSRIPRLCDDPAGSRVLERRRGTLAVRRDFLSSSTLQLETANDAFETGWCSHLTQCHAAAGDRRQQLRHNLGPGPCTPPGDKAVGRAGPAMNGGQLMAGVGQCRRIGGWHTAQRYRAPAYAYGAAGWAPGWGATAYGGGAPGYAWNSAYGWDY